jgi:hypothetical protein
MKIIAFAGSNSLTSINKQLVSYAISLFKGADTEVLDLNDYEAPLYQYQREEREGIPQVIKTLAAKIDAADLLVIALAEHNGNFTTAFKNTMDWLSRVPNRKAWGDRRVLLLATSPGPRGAQSVLNIAVNEFPFRGATVVGSFSLPSFGDTFDTEKGCIKDPAKDAELKQLVNSL